jgi:hypothetical protein
MRGSKYTVVELVVKFDMVKTMKALEGAELRKGANTEVEKFAIQPE